jgi:hypothetical protein
MQQMIEFFEMVSLNEAGLLDADRIAVLQARLALRVFERAINRLRSEPEERAMPPEASVPIAA